MIATDVEPKAKHVFRIKRVHDGLSVQDGLLFLADPLWPRGIKKESLRLTGWQKDVAPSLQLRKWFNHDPAKWMKFRRRYYVELKKNSAVWKPLLTEVQKDDVTLPFAARHLEINHAAVLKAFLKNKQQPIRER